MQYLIIPLVIIIILFFGKIKLDQLKRKLEREYVSKEKKRIEQQNKINRSEIDKSKIELQLLKEQKKDIEETNKNLERILKEQIDEKLVSYESSEKYKINEAIKNFKKEKTQALENEFNETILKYNETIEDCKKQVEEAKAEIDDFAQKQQSINEEILRQRELEEQKDFYRVCIPEEAKEDIAALQSIRSKLKKTEVVDKFIYDNYISKPVLEMLKRVLQNTTCSGIYKITCQPTKEIYIGKSTDIKNRWQQHCKSAFNCGTIASSLLHTKMKQHGLENFTFEVIEKVPKEQLTEREKFYINFYQSKEFGLNERIG